jgi:hypothetical protein
VCFFVDSDFEGLRFQKSISCRLVLMINDLRTIGIDQSDMIEGGRARGVFRAKIESDGGCWCEVVIAGSSVRRVYISEVEGSGTQRWGEGAQPKGCGYKRRAKRCVNLGKVAIVMAHKFYSFEPGSWGSVSTLLVCFLVPGMNGSSVRSLDRRSSIQPRCRSQAGAILSEGLLKSQVLSV